jgi:dUTP pyrophosphatase
MSKVQVKIRKTTATATIPKYALHGDAGLDLTATSVHEVNESDHGFIEYGIGIALEIPPGYYGDLRPRSSICNTGLILANSPCTIDSGFRGEIRVRFKYVPNTNKYNVGDRVAQLIVLPYPEVELIEVEELVESIRGERQFGSTGN